MQDGKAKAKTNQVMVSPLGKRTVIYALVPSNPLVKGIAKRFRWNPETLISRVEKALPSVVEQQIYLRVGEDFRIHPESLAKLLREFLGHTELIPEDFFDKPVGDNLVYNKAADVAEYLEGCFNLINKISIDYSGVGISMKSAATLVKIYGPDGAEAIIDSIAVSLEDVSARMGWKDRSFERALCLAIGFLVKKVIPDMQKQGTPAVLDIMDYFEDIDQLVQYELNRFVGKDD